MGIPWSNDGDDEGGGEGDAGDESDGGGVSDEDNGV